MIGKRYKKVQRLLTLSIVLALISIGFNLIAEAQPAGAPKAWKGRVVHVSDGDTAAVLRPAAKGCWSIQKLRLAGVDAPELKQPYGKTARNYTAGFLYGRTLQIKTSDTDNYGRLIGTLCRGSSSPYRCLSYQLVRKGLAWHYKKYSKDKRLARAEAKARKEKIGLWKQNNPIPPWEWRKKNKPGR